MCICQSQTLAEPFVRSEEEELVPYYGTAYGKTELITLEWRLLGIEKVSRIQRAIPMILKKGSVKFVSSGTRGDVENPAGSAAIFSRIGVSQNCEFLNRLDATHQPLSTCGIASKCIKDVSTV